jgi:hypothetical protein
VRLDIPGVDLPVPKHELQVRPFWVLSRVGLVAAVAAAVAADGASTAAAASAATAATAAAASAATAALSDECGNL